MFGSYSHEIKAHCDSCDRTSKIMPVTTAFLILKAEGWHIDMIHPLDPKDYCPDCNKNRK